MGLIGGAVAQTLPIPRAIVVHTLRVGEMCKSPKIQVENVEEKSVTDNNFAMVNIHITSATSEAVLIIIILALALGSYLIAK